MARLFWQPLSLSFPLPLFPVNDIHARRLELSCLEVWRMLKLPVRRDVLHLCRASKDVTHLRQLAGLSSLPVGVEQQQGFLFAVARRFYQGNDLGVAALYSLDRPFLVKHPIRDLQVVHGRNKLTNIPR